MSREEQQEKLETQVIGPGQILKLARVSANLSIKDIALKTHLKSTLIEDLEADIHDNNISLTFIKGYLKLYAKQVSVSESDIMKAFESINIQKKEPAKLQSFSRRVANQANDDKLMLVTYFILAVVFALVVVWWFQQGESGDTDAAILSETIYAQDRPDSTVNQAPEGIGIGEQTAIQAQQIINDEARPVDEIDSQLVNLEPDAAALNSSPENLTDLATQEPPAAEAQQILVESTQSQMAEIVELVFTFAEDCWMNLSDATGENIAYGVKASGRVMPVSGLPPFIVTLGAPQSVQINYAGEAVDMSVFKPGNTAKFTLPLAD